MQGEALNSHFFAVPLRCRIFLKGCPPLAEHLSERGRAPKHNRSCAIPSFLFGGGGNATTEPNDPKGVSAKAPRRGAEAGKRLGEGGTAWGRGRRVQSRRDPRSRFEASGSPKATPTTEARRSGGNDREKKSKGAFGTCLDLAFLIEGVTRERRAERGVPQAHRGSGRQPLDPFAKGQADKERLRPIQLARGRALATASCRIHLKFLREFCVYPKRPKEHAHQRPTPDG